MNMRDPADDEALRNEIQTAIAAGREVGPDMDRHLADSVLERYRTEQAARNKALATQKPAQPPAPSQTGDAIARSVITVAAIAAFIAIIVWQPHLWWVVFFLPSLFGVWRWGHWDHGNDRRDRLRDRRDRYYRLSDGRNHDGVEHL